MRSSDLPSSIRAALLAATLALPALPAVGQNIRTGTVAERYAQLCAACHGAELQGGQAPSMLDDVWAHGGDDDSLARSIREGFPDKGMPPWGAALPEKEIRAMVIFLRERRAEAVRAQTQFIKPAESMTAQTELHSYKLDTWVGDLTEPYSLAFLPGNRAVVTEKRGQLFLIENGKRGEKPISGMPEVDIDGQAGLFDVVAHPNYAQNGWPIITYGMNYNGTAWTDITAKEGMEQPLTYWVPSLAVCGINFYTGDAFPKWKNHLFVASLAAEELRRIELQDGKVMKQETIFKSLGRIRHVIGGPDGALYVLLPNRIARLAPSE